MDTVTADLDAAPAVDPTRALELIDRGLKTTTRGLIPGGEVEDLLLDIRNALVN